MQFFLACVYTIAFAYCVTPLVIHFAKKYKLVDDARFRKHPANTHTGVVPRGGGIAIFLALLVGCLFFIPMSKILIGILIGAFLIVVMGSLDDRIEISPYVRLVVSVIIVAIVISFGLGVPYISNPFGGVIHLDTIVWTVHVFGVHKFYLLSNLFSIIWIMAIMSFVDFSGGVDGQLPGFVAIAAFFLGIFAYRFSGHAIPTESISILSFVISGAFLGFLFWNFYPQKIMPGYGGKVLGGFLIGVLSVLSWAKIGTMILVLSIPFVDAIYVIIRRIMNGKSPFRGDAGHFHHRLLSLGWGRRRIAVFYWIVSALMGIASLYFEGIQKLLAAGIIMFLLLIFIIVINRINEDKHFRTS